MAGGGIAARGTLALVASRCAFFVLGYVVAVLLARGLGPALYGTYGVIIALLVWLEQSARQAVPAATAKLLAEDQHRSATLGWSALAINLPLHLTLMIAIWIAAPALATWWHIDGGAWLFRIAALDLPMFALFATLQAIHQGRRNFIRIGVVEVAYMATKVIGVAWLVHAGMSVAGALVVNVASSVVGALLLFGGTGPWPVWPRLAMVRPLAAMAVPIGIYSLFQLYTSNLDVVILKLVLPAGEGAIVGIYVGALNIARAPGAVLAVVTAVLLPSIASAVARGDDDLVRHYVRQALRFFAMLFVPAYLVLASHPEMLMQLLYSSAFAGGGTLLPVLLLAHGLWAVHAILGFVLIAAGQVRQLAILMAAIVLPATLMFAVMVNAYQGMGAALANVVVPTVGVACLAVLLRRRLGWFVPTRSLASIALAGMVMFGVGLVFPVEGPLIIAVWTVGLIAYGAMLLFLGEVRRADLAAVSIGRTSIGSRD